MSAFTVGDRVRFTSATVRRAGGDEFHALACGSVLSIERRFARVDFGSSWIPHESGATVRAVPLANLERVPGS
jgi:hypothetical protein